MNSTIQVYAKSCLDTLSLVFQMATPVPILQCRISTTRNTNPTHDNTNHTSTFPDKEDVEDSDKDTPEEFIVPNWKALNCCLLSISSLSIKPLNDFFTRRAFSRHDGLSYQHSDIILANTIKF